MTLFSSSLPSFLPEGPTFVEHLLCVSSLTPACNLHVATFNSPSGPGNLVLLVLCQTRRLRSHSYEVAYLEFEPRSIWL